jgi:hypothetical protein
VGAARIAQAGSVTTNRSDGLIPISGLRAWALMIWGPADSWDNPLTGTRYDPILRARRQTQRRAERRERHVQRRPQLRAAQSTEQSDPARSHFTWAD